MKAGELCVLCASIPRTYNRRRDGRFFVRFSMTSSPSSGPASWLQPARVQLLVKAACTLPTLVFLAVYVPLAGHGFLSDDFRWVLNSQIESVADVIRLFRITDGFYRPLVSLTFGLDRLVFGLNPRPYGWTNVGLVLGAALLIRQLAIALGLSKGAGTLAASLWFLNFHGINQSILWVSGRTSLVVACAGTACAILVVRRQLLWAVAFLALAFLAKEEALTLPFVLTAWLYVLGQDDTASRARMMAVWLLGSALVMALYLVLRSQTGAMTPATAPGYYQFTFEPAVVWRNALEYADRAATTSAIAVLLGMLLLWPKGFRLDASQRRIVLCAALWLAGGYGITVFLPVRSSLYSIVPSIGACLAAAVVLGAAWQSADVPHRFRALCAAILLPVCLMPVYLARTASVPLADFSTQVLRDLRDETHDIPDAATIVVVDDRSTKINVASAFGTLLNEAVLLTTGRRLNMWIEPPAPGTEGVTPPCESCVARRLRVVNGRLIH
jgi:hypothetical protein